MANENNLIPGRKPKNTAQKTMDEWSENYIAEKIAVALSHRFESDSDIRFELNKVDDFAVTDGVRDRVALKRSKQILAVVSNQIIKAVKAGKLSIEGFATFICEDNDGLVEEYFKGSSWVPVLPNEEIYYEEKTASLPGDYWAGGGVGAVHIEERAVASGQVGYYNNGTGQFINWNQAEMPMVCDARYSYLVPEHRGVLFSGFDTSAQITAVSSRDGSIRQYRSERLPVLLFVSRQLRPNQAGDQDLIYTVLPGQQTRMNAWRARVGRPGASIYDGSKVPIFYYWSMMSIDERALAGAVRLEDLSQQSVAFESFAGADGEEILRAYPRKTKMVWIKNWLMGGMIRRITRAEFREKYSSMGMQSYLEGLGAWPALIPPARRVVTKFHEKFKGALLEE